MIRRTVAAMFVMLALAACGSSASRSTTRESTTAIPTFPESTSTTAARPKTQLGVVTETVDASAPANGYRVVVRKAQWGAHARTWRVAVPVSEPEPLGERTIMFVLHGVGGSGLNARALGFEPLTQGSGTVLVYPDAVDGSWNDARINVDARADRENVDDGGFLVALVSDIRKRFGVPRGFVAAAGFSNGGIMAAALACVDDNLEVRTFRALAIVGASGPPHETGCGFTSSSVIVMQGTADPVVPFIGGTVAPYKGHVRGRVVGHPQFIADLSAQSQCRELTTSWQNAGGYRIGRERGVGCLDPSFTPEGYVIEGGGHEWLRAPGFDTTKIVWEFFVARGAAPR